MNFKFLSRKLFVGFIFVCFVFNLHAQTTTLVYKVKGKKNFAAEINFTKASGATKVSPQDFFKQKNIYFTLTASASSKGYFKESDIEKILSKVSLLQNEKAVVQIGSPRSLLNIDSRIDRIVIAFSKSDFTIYKNFAFSVNGLFSDKINIDEKYYETYESSKALFDRAMLSYEAKQYIESYKALFVLYVESLKNSEIKAMSFYGKALETIDKGVDSFIANAESHIEALNQSFVNEGSEKTLNDFKESVQGIQTYSLEFKDYFESDLNGVRSIGLRFEDFKNKTEKQLKDNIQLFKEKRMELLEKNNYLNYQFTSYIDLLARLLIDVDSLFIIDKLTPIDLNKVDAFIEEYSVLYLEQKQEFKILIGLINNNISQGYVLNEKVIFNLEENKEYQKQPYFEIFSALNSVEKDKEAFDDYLNDALVYCTDELLLGDIELWQLSSMLTKDRIGKQTLSQINDGMQLLEKKRWKQAEDKFNMLKRQVNGFAPIWYYLGELKYNMGELFSAEVQFNRALSIHREYIAPQKFKLDIFETEGNYTQLLSTAEEAISAFDIWIFRYYKAKALLYLRKYNLAIDELLTYCIAKNQWNTSQYFLLGDAYFESKMYDEAKAAYIMTQEIDPFNSDSKQFDSRMRLVNQKENSLPIPKPLSKPNPKPIPTKVVDTSSSVIK